MRIDSAYFGTRGVRFLVWRLLKIYHGFRQMVILRSFGLRRRDLLWLIDVYSRLELLLQLVDREEAFLALA